METLADLFRPYKKAHLADEVGVSEPIVTGWMSGAMGLHYAHIEPLAQYLGVNRERVIDACIATGGAPVGP